MLRIGDEGEAVTELVLVENFFLTAQGMLAWPSGWGVVEPSMSRLSGGFTN